MVLSVVLTPVRYLTDSKILLTGVFLLDNAIKYSEDTTEIHIHGSEIVSVDKYRCQIVVADNDIGIATDHLAYIFDKFYRVPKGNRDDVKGYGLGLYYVRMMIDKHGGQVKVDSTPGKGTKFTIII